MVLAVLVGLGAQELRDELRHHLPGDGIRDMKLGLQLGGGRRLDVRRIDVEADEVSILEVRGDVRLDERDVPDHRVHRQDLGLQRALAAELGQLPVQVVPERFPALQAGRLLDRFGVGADLAPAQRERGARRGRARDLVIERLQFRVRRVGQRPRRDGGRRHVRLADGRGRQRPRPAPFVQALLDARPGDRCRRQQRGELPGLVACTPGERDGVGVQRRRGGAVATRLGDALKDRGNATHVERELVLDRALFDVPLRGRDEPRARRRQHGAR